MADDLVKCNIMKENLDYAKKLLRRDFDVVGVIDGYVGSGKSTLATQMCKYVDPSFSVDRIAFNSTELLKMVSEAKEGQAIMLDESMSGAHSRRAISKLNTDLVQMMAKIRQKNLFILFVLPSFFDLDKNIAVDRSRFLVHCYTQGLKRGFYTFYGPKRKKYLFIKGKQYYAYNVSPNTYGSFTKGYGVDEEEYRKRKAADLEQYEEDAEPLSEKDILRKYVIERIDEIGDKHPQTLLSEIFGVSRTTLYNWRKELGVVESSPFR